ncbi:MAG: hypothetical protein J6M17_00105 [Ruminococcus sp.]|nr:hypothetical protein [Ruminococcus sp.]MBQ5316403.1 hypothetical protein [Oscillospiraceae bacterium]
MNSGRPDVILKKYRSILFSALAVELVTFIVSLMDPVIAGSRIGLDALSAISLFSPFISVSTFVAAVINTGTLVNYTNMIGSFQNRRANEVFSQGTVMAVFAGVVMTSVILLIKPLFISSLSLSAELEGYLDSYYTIAAFYPMFFPVNCILNNIIVTEGGEKYAAITGIVSTIGNILLSYWFAGAFGVTGIAVASLASNIIFTVSLVAWFFIRKSNVRFVRCFSFADLFLIIKCGIVKASKFASASIMLWILDLYFLRNFDEITFKVWMIDQNIINMSAVFLGLAMTLQPMIGTLVGEKNTKAIRILVRCLIRDLVIIGAGCSAVVICLTRPILRFLGATDETVLNTGVTALRTTSLTIVFSAVTASFFVYYILVDRQILAFVISFLADLICPTGLVILFGTLSRSPMIIWGALAVSGALALLLSAVIVWLHRKQSSFPLLLPKGQDEIIHIFSFEITAENSSEMAETTGRLLSDKGFSKRLQLLVSACIEDMLGLIAELNADRKDRLFAECTLITEDRSVRMILRDTGKKFDISEMNTAEHSFLRYTVERLMTAADHNAYISTTGYNRNELMFNESQTGKDEK